MNITMKVSDVSFERRELEQQLLPLLRAGVISTASKTWAKAMATEVREKLAMVLPFNKDEKEFLDLVLDEGRIEPGLLTDDADLADRVGRQPMLLWVAQKRAGAPAEEVERVEGTGPKRPGLWGNRPVPRGF